MELEQVIEDSFVFEDPALQREKEVPLAAEFDVGLGYGELRKPREAA